MLSDVARSSHHVDFIALDRLNQVDEISCEVPAGAGLLDDRRAATHRLYADELGTRYPAVKVDPDVLWVDEGSVLTSAGLAAGIDLCVQPVRADYGTDAAISIARYMVVAPHRDGAQAQLLERPVPPPAESLAATCGWALEHLAEPLTVADLARHAGWAPRTFARRFIAETGGQEDSARAARRSREEFSLSGVVDLARGRRFPSVSKVQS